MKNRIENRMEECQADHIIAEVLKKLPVIEEAMMWGELPRTSGTSEWVKALESRLNKQRKELSSMLDYADEDFRLLPTCVRLRQQMQKTKERLADFYFLRERFN